MPDPSPQQLAEQVCDAMLANDHASKMLGMQVVDVAPGRAVMRMTVRQDMLESASVAISPP